MEVLEIEPKSFWTLTTRPVRRSNYTLYSLFNSVRAMGTTTAVPSSNIDVGRVVSVVQSWDFHWSYRVSSILFLQRYTFTEFPFSFHIIIFQHYIIHTYEKLQWPMTPWRNGPLRARTKQPNTRLTFSTSSFPSVSGFPDWISSQCYVSTDPTYRSKIPPAGIRISE